MINSPTPWLRRLRKPAARYRVVMSRSTLEGLKLKKRLEKRKDHGVKAEVL